MSNIIKFPAYAVSLARTQKERGSIISFESVKRTFALKYSNKSIEETILEYFQNLGSPLNLRVTAKEVFESNPKYYTMMGIDSTQKMGFKLAAMWKRGLLKKTLKSPAAYMLKI